MTGSFARFDLGDRAGTQEPGTPGVKKDNGGVSACLGKACELAVRYLNGWKESAASREGGGGGLICEKRGAVRPEESYIIDCSSFIMATS
jgi:hypothetical protein